MLYLSLLPAASCADLVVHDMVHVVLAVQPPTEDIVLALVMGPVLALELSVLVPVLVVLLASMACGTPDSSLPLCGHNLNCL